jgi:hypothetical protein
MPGSPGAFRRNSGVAEGTLVSAVLIDIDSVAAEISGCTMLDQVAQRLGRTVRLSRAGTRRYPLQGRRNGIRG